MGPEERYIRACIGLSLAYETYHDSVIQRDFTEDERKKNAKILREWLVEYRKSKGELVNVKEGTRVSFTFK